MKKFGIILTYSLFLIPFSFLRAAPAPVPKEALKALQIAKGKPCKTGVVFMDGKYLAPPYVVKRYGTAIMINDVQVTAPLVAWEDFLKTQEGVKVTRSETPAAAPEPVVEEPPEPEVEETEDEDDPLADLFDDDPKPAKKKAAPKKKRVVRKPPKPTVTTTYAMEGEFEMNDASKALVEKINRYRTDINARLMKGGFFFFGSNYARVSGEVRETKRLLEKLPAMMRSSSDGAALYAEARRNNFFYLTEAISADLFRNKYLYPQIEARARQMSEDEALNGLMRGTFR